MNDARIGLLFGAVAVLFVPVVGLAATFNVNANNDLPDAASGNGVCEATTSSGNCTLRAAIMEANALAGTDTINLPAGIYVLSLAGEDDVAAVGDLDVVGGTLNINGAGTDSTIIDANGIDRVFQQITGTLRLNDLTVRNGAGTADSSVGGGISITGFSDQPAEFELRRSRVINNAARVGGGIFSNTWVTIVIEDSLIEGNQTSDVGVGNRRGAALWSQGSTITFDRVTVTGNGDALSGKVIDIENDAQLFMVNSTISGNHFGGALAITNAHAKIIFSNIINNDGPNLSFFSFDDSHVFEIGMSVLQHDNHVNCQGGDLPTSLGYNVVSDDTCLFANAGDVENSDAMLAPLADNGSFTPTHLPFAGSPLIDRVPTGACNNLDGGNPLLTDQRGMGRPFGPACDSGSVESGVPPVPPIFSNGFEDL